MSAVNEKTAEFRNLSETEIERVIAGLGSISKGELGTRVLFSCVERDVPPLRRFPLPGQRVIAQRGESE
jgi:hypothetical protein